MTVGLETLELDFPLLSLKLEGGALSQGVK